MRFESWGRYPHSLNNRHIIYKDGIPQSPAKLLPFGNGRSYGDCCLISDGVYLDSAAYDHIISLDVADKKVTVQSGVLLKRLLRFLTKKNFFLPVVPGTQLVTVGGAIANDIHGKSHHIHGSFGNNVDKIRLNRSTRGSLELSLADNLFKATVGGIGLTGFIESATLSIIEIPGEFIKQEVKPCDSLHAVAEALSEFSLKHSYTVAWIDLVKNPPRGLVMGGDFVEMPTRNLTRDFCLTYPFDFCVVNPLSIRLLNFFYYNLNILKRASIVHYEKFFFPLDAVLNWNRAYGPGGFMQWQGVFPRDVNLINEIVTIIRNHGALPTLAVLKDFGKVAPVGYLSFPKEGFTLAIDFQVSWNSFKAVDELNNWVCQVGGRVYLAKDSRLRSDLFQKMYPSFSELLNHKDPAIESDMFRRLTSKSEGA